MDFVLRSRTFNDPADRVIWRTKQVIDFTFLFSYVSNHEISEYHLIAEDDLIVSNQFVTAIRDYVQLKKNVRWTALQFSSFVGIGLLFRSRELEKLSQFLLMFHRDQPVDMLMRTFSAIQVNWMHIQIEPSKNIFLLLNNMRRIRQRIKMASSSDCPPYFSTLAGHRLCRGKFKELLTTLLG